MFHNGLSQALCATKLHLDQLDTFALHDLPNLTSFDQQTACPLVEALRPTNQLAHELALTS